MPERAFGHRGTHCAAPTSSASTGGGTGSGIVETPAGVAQLVAHSTCNRAVRGSSPLTGSGRSPFDHVDRPRAAPRRTVMAGSQGAAGDRLVGTGFGDGARVAEAVWALVVALGDVTHAASCRRCLLSGVRTRVGATMLGDGAEPSQERGQPQPAIGSDDHVREYVAEQVGRGVCAGGEVPSVALHTRQPRQQKIASTVIEVSTWRTSPCGHSPTPCRSLLRALPRRRSCRTGR